MKKSIQTETRRLKKHLHFIDQHNLAHCKGVERKSLETINQLLQHQKECLLYLKQTNKDTTPQIITKRKEYKHLLYRTQAQLTLSLPVLENHLTKQDYLYYTNKPDTNSVLVCLDFDCQNESYEVSEHSKAREQLVSFLQYYFPCSFYDFGSSGNSLNHYIFIDVSEICKGRSKTAAGLGAE